MKFFVDTAEVSAIRGLLETGLLDGVTTNPSLIAKSGRNFLEVIEEICGLTHAPVSAEVASLDYQGMIDEGERLAALATNVVVKLPLTPNGLRACAHFNKNGIKTNVTLCFTINQAMIAAKSGATYISPFIGRLDDLNIDGGSLISSIRQVYDIHGFGTEIIAASVRTQNHVSQAALAGAHIATIPPNIINTLYDHPLTRTGIDKFEEDWRSTGQSILG